MDKMNKLSKGVRLLQRKLRNSKYKKIDEIPPESFKKLDISDQLDQLKYHHLWSAPGKKSFYRIPDTEQYAAIIKDENIDFEILLFFFGESNKGQPNNVSGRYMTVTRYRPYTDGIVPTRKSTEAIIKENYPDMVSSVYRRGESHSYSSSLRRKRKIKF